MNQFNFLARAPTSQPTPLDSAELVKVLSNQEQAVLSGGEIKICKNGLKSFLDDFLTCRENKEVSQIIS